MNVLYCSTGTGRLIQQSTLNLIRSGWRHPEMTALLASKQFAHVTSEGERSNNRGSTSWSGHGPSSRA